MSEIVFFYSPVGWLRLTGNSQFLQEITFTNESGPSETKFEILHQAVAQLKEYFEGTRFAFDVPLHPMGTAFQQKVWQALSAIPYGQTVSYKAIAIAVKNPKAVRAVGAANGKNPIPIIIPCHRVIGANGDLVGYSSGLWRKEWLLNHERSHKVELNS